MLERSIRRWGIVLLVAYAVMVPLSFAVAPLSPREVEQPQEEATLRSFVNGIPGLGADAKNALDRIVSGETILTEDSFRAAAFFLPLLLATAGSLLLLRTLRARKFLLSDAELTTLARWAIAFSVVSIFIYPMTTKDFWLSMVWGRLTAAGLNPYYEPFSPGVLAGMAVREGGERMTYGPLWAYITGFVSLLARRQPVIEFLAFKVLLAGAWLVTLIALRRVARMISPERDVVAIWVMGWLPFILHMTVAEGHNDIVMVLFLVCWLWLVAARRHLLSPVALAAATLIKYITAPLALLEVLRGWTQMKGRRRGYVLVLLGVLLASAALLLPFARDRHMFDPVLRMHKWSFWTPTAAVMRAGFLLGAPISIRIAWGLMFVVYAALFFHALMMYLRQPSVENFAALTLVVITSILLGGVGHVWPWFIVWVVPLCVLVRRPALVTFVLVLALEAPFLHWDWIVGFSRPGRQSAGLVLYAIAGAAAVSVWLKNQARARDQLTGLT